MVGWILKKILGSKNQRELKRLMPIVHRINEFDEQYKSLSDEALRAKTAIWKEELAKVPELEDQWKRLDEILPEAFAVVKNAARRLKDRQDSFMVCDQPMKWDMVHFDVQLLGGIVLHRGRIAEMATGEGKTLVATLPLYLNALTGRGVHLVTVNDYLARRDVEWMGRLYDFLGLTVGCIQHDQEPDLRREQYAMDVTYGTNSEFGFDYLRDNGMATTREQQVQRGYFYAIVDEVDSILVDEARTPLIISGPSTVSTHAYDKYKPQVADLVRAQTMLCNRFVSEAKQLLDGRSADKSTNDDFDREKEKKKQQIQQAFDERSEKIHNISQLLRAYCLFEKDVEYVVQDNKVMIVDEFTGRLMPGRRWSDGLHQAVEAKEGVAIERETQTLATITIQNYFRLYKKLAGMTGTAETEATEFENIYKLGVIVVPTNRPVQRKDANDSVYKTKREKYNAVIKEIKDVHAKGRPILVGTISVEVSEHLSRMLKKAGIVHSVLNAKYHQQEAEIVARAGQRGSVTIATNMAGRGTDIKLGTGVPDIGGLHVIGTERHEARRIDRQLRGRCARQGDPGSSQLFIGLEDDLMRLFGSDKIVKYMERMGLEEGQELEHPLLNRSIGQAQKRMFEFLAFLEAHALHVLDDFVGPEQ